jgi:hypothetical protein
MGTVAFPTDEGLVFVVVGLGYAVISAVLAMRAFATVRCARESVVGPRSTASSFVAFDLRAVLMYRSAASGLTIERVTLASRPSA